MPLFIWWNMANTRIGEVGINWDGKEYILRPSFYRLNQLEDCEQYLQTASECLWLIDHGVEPGYLKLLDCVYVLQTLADDLMPEKLTGYPVASAVKGGLKWKMGQMTLRATAALAVGLLKQGLYGKPSRDRVELAKLDKRISQNTDKFDLLKFVGMAMAPNGLGKSSSDAWAMTMIEFQAAMDAQYPLTEKDKARIPPPPEVMQKLASKVDSANAYLKKLGPRRAVKLGAR